MILLQVKNLLGLERADLKILPAAMTLLAGPNGSGKSTAAETVAALLLGEKKVVEAIDIGQSEKIIRGGASVAEARLTTANGGCVQGIWEKKSARIVGNAPLRASKEAVGRKSLLDLAEKDFAARLRELLRAEPTEKDLVAEVVDIGYTKEEGEGLWKKISATGWDAVHKNVKKVGADNKAVWSNKTSVGYGATQAALWCPRDWETDLAMATEEQLKKEIESAQKIRDAAVACFAVEENEEEKLKELIALKEDRQAALDAAREVTKEKERIWLEVRADNSIKGLGPYEYQKVYKCHHCQSDLIVKGDVTLPPEAGIPTQEELHRIAEKRKEHQALVAQLEAEYHAAQATEAEIGLAFRESYKAEQRLEQLAAGEKTTPAEIKAAAERLAKAEQRLAAFRLKAEADTLYAQIERNQKLIDLLAPDGLCKRKLSTALEELNKELAELCTTAEFPLVSITPSLQVRYGNLEYAQISEGQKFRVKVILQCWCTQVTKSEILVIDGADILDNGGRRGLFRLSQHMQLPFFVCMTASKPEEVPNLGKMGKGVSYWLEDSQVKELV